MVVAWSKYRAQCGSNNMIEITGKQLPRKRESYIAIISLIAETLAESGRRTRDAGSQWITGMNPGGAYCRLLSSPVVWALWQLLGKEQQCIDRVRVIAASSLAGWLSLKSTFHCLSLSHCCIANRWSSYAPRSTVLIAVQRNIEHAERNAFQSETVHLK